MGEEFEIPDPGELLVSAVTGFAPPAVVIGFILVNAAAAWFGFGKYALLASLRARELTRTVRASHPRVWGALLTVVYLSLQASWCGLGFIAGNAVALPLRKPIDSRRPPAIEELLALLRWDLAAKVYVAASVVFLVLAYRRSIGRKDISWELSLAISTPGLFYAIYGAAQVIEGAPPAFWAPVGVMGTAYVIATFYAASGAARVVALWRAGSVASRVPSGTEPVPFYSPGLGKGPAVSVVVDSVSRPLAHGVSTLGRAPDCTVSLPHDDSVAPYHAEIHVTEKGVMVFSLNRKYTTTLDDVPVAKSGGRVRNGAHLTLGWTLLVVEIR